MVRILLLEDDALLSQTLHDLLCAQDFDVDVASDGEEALALCYEHHYDLYLFDVNVPLLGGIDVLKLLRESGDKTPAFFVSALRDIQTITKAFDSACDDYIKKPFEFDELLVRIKAHIVKKNPFVCYGAVRYDLAQKRLFLEDKEIDLGSVDKEIFDLLLRNQGQLIYKEQFFDVMEKPTDLALRVHIAKLKKRLGLHISNIKGIGYRLESV
jgi:two-component system OmpR family response regulator